MKTAMQELIDEIEKYWVGSVNQITIREKAIELLEKEKEQIKKAFSDGQETPLNHPNLPHYSNDEYYNDNFNSKN